MIKSPFKLPASAPRQRVAAAAMPMESPPSRQSLPKTTAERPINDPTDRSMPPVVITGVKATARRPISTLRRSTSNALASEKKLVPITAKTAISRSQETHQNRLGRLEPEAAVRELVAISLGAVVAGMSFPSESEIHPADGTGFLSQRLGAVVLAPAAASVMARNCFHEITSMPRSLISAAIAGSIKIRRSPSRWSALLVIARNSSSATPQ